MSMSLHLFYKNVPREIKRKETFFKNSVQIYSMQLEIFLMSFINQQQIVNELQCGLIKEISWMESELYEEVCVYYFYEQVVH